MSMSSWCGLYVTAILVLATARVASVGTPSTSSSPGTAPAAPSKQPDILVKGGNYTFAAAPSVSPVYTYWVG